MSKDGWEPVQRLRTHEQVMAQIEQRMLAGQLKAGDQLPSERELAATLGVSRPTLRESLRVLEALSVVEVRRGGAVLLGTPGTGLVNLLKLQVALGHFSEADLVETRIALETWSCGEAAVHATGQDHRELAAILDDMEPPDIATADFNRLDAAFHVRIAESAGNALTAHLMGSLRTAINQQMIDSYARLADWRETAQTVMAEHRQILAAIERGDPEDASRLVLHHIVSFHSTVLGEVGRRRGSVLPWAQPASGAE